MNLSARKGDIVGIVGTNGVGKSTLLEIVCGLKKETNGEVRFGGQAVNSKTRVRDTFLVMQSSDYQLFTESVEKELFLGNDGNEELQKKAVCCWSGWDYWIIDSNILHQCQAARSSAFALR